MSTGPTVSIVEETPNIVTFFEWFVCVYILLALAGVCSEINLSVMWYVCVGECGGVISFPKTTAMVPLLQFSFLFIQHFCTIDEQMCSTPSMNGNMGLRYGLII